MQETVTEFRQLDLADTLLSALDNMGFMFRLFRLRQFLLLQVLMH